MKKLLLIFFLLIGSLTYGQTTFTQTFVDRCTGEVKVVTANFVNGSATVAFYNRVRTFTYQEFTSGVLQGWLIETYAWWNTLSPCSTTTQQATQAQQQAQQAQQQAQQASTAASNATQSANSATQAASTASTAGTTASTATNATATTGTTQTTTGGTTTTNTGSTNTGSTNTSSSNTSTGGTSNDTTNNTGTTSNDSGTTNSGSETNSGGTETGSTESSSSETSNSGETSDSSSEGSSEGSSSEESSGEVEKKEESKTEESTEEKKEETKEEEKKEEKEETKEEEKEEEKKEEDSEEKDEEEKKEEESKEEEKEEEEKKEKKMMPIQLKADMMTMQTPLGPYNAVLNIGASRSSIYGDVAYTANMMVWDNLQQVSFMGARSKVNMTTDYKVKNILATSIGYSNNYGYSTAMISQSAMKPFQNGLTVGIGVSAGTTFVSYPIKEGFMVSYNVLATKSFKIGSRITYSPALIWTQTPFMSGESGVNFKWENPMGLQMKNMLKGTEIDGMGILANSFTVQLTNRFSFNIGWTAIKSTNPLIPLINSFMIGSKLPF